MICFFLKKALDFMKHAEILLIKLEVKEDSPVIKFYERHGVKFIKKIKTYYENESNALLLYKNIKEVCFR
jgi:ribosomal protein S18 acetylase RimI-like enzyme